MKKITVCVLLLSFSSCSIIVTWFKPKYFTAEYDGKYTGIDTMLNIDGYFYSDSTHDNVVLYRDGTIGAVIANRDYFSKENKNDYGISWGIYTIKNDTIKAQTILNFGGMENMRTGFNTYIIKSKNEIEYYSRHTDRDFLNSEKTLKKIPLYYHPDPNRLDSAHWVKKRKWFWDKEAYKERKKK